MLVLQLEDQAHRVAVLLHSGAGDGGEDLHPLRADGEQPRRHWYKALQQTQVQAPYGPHQQLRRQRVHGRRVQMEMNECLFMNDCLF